MVLYTLASGDTTDVVDLANKLDFYLVDLGWSRHHTVSSGAGLVDRVYFNNGGEPTNNYRDIFARWQGDSSFPYKLKQFGYSYYQEGGGSSSGEISGDIVDNYGVSVSGSTYWFCGNKDVVWVVLKHTISGTHFASSIGYAESYYPLCKDDYPLAVVGHHSVSDSFVDSRVVMYNSVSGTQVFTTTTQSGVLFYGAPQSRDSSYLSLPIALMNKSASYYEVRGQLKAIGQIYGEGISGDTKLTISGTNNTFLAVKHGTLDNTYVYGPFVEQ